MEVFVHPNVCIELARPSDLNHDIETLLSSKFYNRQ